MERRYITRSVPTNNYQWLVVVAMVAVLFVQYSNEGWPFTPNTVVPNDDEQVIDDTTNAAWVVVVEETKGRPASMQVVLDEYDFWFKELPEQEIRFRLFDKDDPACESYKYRAKADGIDIPFVMVVDDSGGVKAVASFPDSIDEIRKLVN